MKPQTDKETTIKKPLLKKKTKSKKRKSTKFWDNDKQKYAAYYYIKKHGLDITRPEIKESVRARMRIETENKKKFKGEKTVSEQIAEFEKTKDLGSIKITKTNHFIKDILTQGVEQALKNGPLPPPTGYDSKDGSHWDNPTDLAKRKRVKFYLDAKGKKQPLPSFGDNDVAWIEFFLGDPITGGTLLKPKKKSEHKYLKRKKLLGKVYPIQQKMSDWLDENPWSKFEVWRGAGKTVIVIGKLLRKMCDNPNECFFLQSETDDKTIQRIRVIKKELQTNQKIIAFYGYLPADSSATGGKKQLFGKDYKGKWSEGVIELKREYSGIEPSLMGISWNTGRGVGYHFTGGVLDDPWSMHNQNREGDKKKYWDWWGEFYGSLEYADFCWVLCTKKGLDDIYFQMDKDRLFATFREKLVIEFPLEFNLIEKNGAVVEAKLINRKNFFRYVNDDCFGKYSIEKVLLIRNRIGNEVFEREYQNNPRRLEGKLFNWNKINICEIDSTDRYAQIPFHEVSRSKMRGLIFYDPAFGLTSGASYNALVAMAEFEKRIYILRIWMGHWTKDERVKSFNHARQMYPTYPFYCEDVMHQLNIIRDLTDSTGIMLRPFTPKGKGIHYKDMFSGQKHSSKKAKIYDGLEPVIEDRRMYIMKKTPYFSEFENEIKNFPDGLKMDVIDATSMGCFLLDRKQGRESVLDSNFHPRDGFLPNNMSIGNVFNIGKHYI